MKGIFKIDEDITSTNPIAVGDEVEADIEDEVARVHGMDGRFGAEGDGAFTPVLYQFPCGEKVPVEVINGCIFKRAVLDEFGV